MTDIGAKIRVLIVDDSTVVRRFLSNAIAADPAFEVVGTAANGQIAVQKVALLSPQVVTMDIEMPEMSGLEALAAIRRTNRTLPIIMVSSLTERGALATLEALSLGATDYVTKPSALTAAGDVEKDNFIRDLLPKLKGLTKRGTAFPSASVAPGAARTPARASVQPLVRRAGRVDIVAIGISTGGPNALADLIPALPNDLPVPIVIVQHMPPLFTRLLAERLASKSVIRVKEGNGGDPLSPGLVILAPGNFHMAVERALGGACHIVLNQGALENSCRPAADVLFRSVSETYGAGVLAIVMTGMGQDGLRGCEAVRGRGGQVMVQDEESSVVWGMPGFVAHAGLADEVLPLTQIAAAIVRSVRVGRDGARSVAGRG
ncbi:MAG TPA: chemotaxis response regulator protein-glutamate methylesterase [Polyangia bacterium]|jgi:two-component system chemotaxis response regulator CheB|nr:chemotaxis response regulator protein-glutamate methylesterase [Polyangia bacterium]